MANHDNTPTPPPEPYKPQTHVEGDKLPRRYRRSAANDAQLAKAARRATLAAVYFGKDI